MPARQAPRSVKATKGLEGKRVQELADLRLLPGAVGAGLRRRDHRLDARRRLGEGKVRASACFVVFRRQQWRWWWQLVCSRGAWHADADGEQPFVRQTLADGAA